MARPDPIQYAERLYGAIRAANFSPISFLAFGNAIKEGTSMRNMPRIAAEPFMRVVGEMLDLEAAASAEEIIEVAAEMEPADKGATIPVPADIAVEQSLIDQGSSCVDSCRTAGCSCGEAQDQTLGRPISPLPGTPNTPPGVVTTPPAAAIV